MQNRAFLKVSPVENVSFFQKEMFEGSYLSSYNPSKENVKYFPGNLFARPVIILALQKKYNKLQTSN
jgi:hypothetical protein